MEKIDTIFFKNSDIDIKKAGEIISKGGIVAFPTETVYGLGADGLNGEAVEKIFLAKGRPSDNPLILHISNFKDVEKIAEDIDENARKLMKAFWPGPLTLILKAREIVPRKTTGGLSSVGVRMPNCDIALDLIKYAKTPIAAPSANLSGRPSPTEASHVIEDMDGKIDGIIDGGSCQVGIESTIVSTIGNDIVILRPGGISKEEIDLVLGFESQFDKSLLKRRGDLEEDFAPMAPGMKYRHYAPKAEMIIFLGEEEKVSKAIDEKTKTLEKQGKKVAIMDYRNKRLDDISRDFFRDLRNFDSQGIEVILARAIEGKGLGFSIMNRMIKSAGYNIVDLTDEKVKDE